MASISPVSATTVDRERSCSSWLGMSAWAVWQRRKCVLSPIHRGPAVLVSARTIASGSRYPDACEHTGTLMADSDKRIALLIDADNAPAAKIDAILNEVARHGVVNVRRAYGNWKSQNLMGWEKVLHEYAIRPIQQFAYSPGKNASDMAMVIDAMDLMYARTLDGFAVVSSDADFTPLVMRLRNDGYAVYGFGQKQTPLPFVKACSTFLFLEKLGDDGDVSADQVRPQTTGELKGDRALSQQLRGAVVAVADDEGWAHLGAVGSHLNNQGSFDPRNYGYRSLSALIDAVDLFEVRREGQAVLVRERPGTETRRRRRPGKAAAAKASPGANGTQ